MSFRGNWWEVVKTCVCGAEVRVNVSQSTFQRRNDRYVFDAVCNQCHSPYKGYLRLEKVPVEAEVPA